MKKQRHGHKEIAASRLPPSVLVRIFGYLSVTELSRAEAVCKKWKRVLDMNDRELWAHHQQQMLPESALSDPYLFANLPNFRDRIRAFKHAWDPLAASKNIFVRTNGFTMHRQPIAQSTDAIRGKVGVSGGVHCWEFCWEGPLGTTAICGICTKHAALHCPGYIPLIGSDDQSWGWNLVDNTIAHNGKNLGCYPQLNNIPKYQIGERVRMILDHGKGQLYFEKGDEFFGLAFSGLPPVRLFPAVAAVYGNTEVTMVYLGPPVVG